MKLDFEKFLADNGLKLGDKIKFKNHNDTVYRITMNFMTKFLYLENVDTGTHIDIQYLAKVDFEIIKPKKKVGELFCGYEIIKKCASCPLRCINCECEPNVALKLRDKLEEIIKKFPELEPMREYLEAELEKEVEE